MFSLLKKPVKAEVIHAEFDASEERILQACDSLLRELKIPTENHVERKANDLVALGFTGAEPVKIAESIVERKNEITARVIKTQKIANTIKELKQNYPFEKFITVEELDRICEKYGLIHAPVNNYIKDVPEKNVLEMKRCKPLAEKDKMDVEIRLVGLSSDYLLKLFNKKEPVFYTSDLLRINYRYDPLKEWFLKGDSTWAYCAVTDGIDGKKGKKNAFYVDYSFDSAVIISKKGLFIAAPQSHFDLKGLSKKTKYGYFNVRVEVPDPVVFEYCKENIIRIITKWGTEDDQSYLDPALTNEIFN
ncbi:hypothetical protein [Leptolyngbya phage Lbo-JY46]